MIADFSGHKVLVTGAGHGLGRAIASAFADRGAAVVATDINRDALAETKKLDPKIEETAFLDVTRRDDVRALVDWLGRVDILVNCAGGVAGQAGRPIEEVTPEQWQVIFDINTLGAFHTVQAVVPGMKAARRGRIVNISSGAGIAISLTGIQAYASAKAALIGFTRQMAHELGPWNITVNSVAPGFIRCNPTTERQWEAYGEEGQRKLIEAIALRRLGEPQDISSAVMFFASPFAGWITGQTLSVDGGK